MRSLLSAATNSCVRNFFYKQIAVPFSGKPVLIASLIITALIFQVKQTGGLESLELAAFDRMMQLQPNESLDPRILVVAITEADIHQLRQWPLSDQSVSQVLEKLQHYQPRVVGLDLHRDIPQPPGNQALLKQLKADNVIVIAKLDDADASGVPAPPGIPEERVGFNDFVLDPDGVIRRNFMFAFVGEQKFYSFSLRLSLKYLANYNISLNISPTSLQLSKKSFIPLESNSGGYQTIDAQGYQVLLNYRSSQNAVRQVTVTQVLQGKVNPEWVKDKIVLIGTTAPSAKDLFFTPYSWAERKNPKMPGVTIHAQMVSQILSTVLNEQPLFWFFSPAKELIWVWGWSMLGGMLAWWFKHPLFLTLFEIAALAGLCGVSYAIFMQFGWMPIVEPILALGATSWAIVAYKQLNLQKTNQRLSDLVFVDGLTQVANRRRFDEFLWQEWRRSARDVAPLSLILCDVDCFKSYNDTYGHQAGDVCLHQVAQAIKRVVKRPADLVARYGGEEFAVVLPNTNIKGASYVASMICLEMQKLQLPHETSSVCAYVTLSMGVSCTVSKTKFLPNALIGAADEALYQAKEQGRNRAVIKNLALI